MKRVPAFEDEQHPADRLRFNLNEYIPFRVWAASPGPGGGSTFLLQFPPKK